MSLNSIHNYQMGMAKMVKRIWKMVTMIVIAFSLNCCNPVTINYTLIYSTDEPIGEISKTLETVLERNWNVDIQLSIGEGSQANLDSLREGKIQFTIVENHVDYVEGVSTVLVFYPQILHLFHTKDYEPQSFEELVYDRKVFIGAEGSGSYKFMMDLFDFFNLDESRITITQNPFDDFNVYAGFTDILHDDELLGLSSFSLYSFDDVENLGKGSVLDGIALKFPKVQQYIIPEKTYGDITSKPIATLASNAVLVCQSDMLDNPITDMIKTVFKEKQAFNDISPLIFTNLKEDFDRMHLTFPLHNGARVYLDRDEPGFFERYAELAGVLFSVIIALISGLISLSKWQTQKKKDRVDVFYKVLMDIKKALPNIHSSQEAIKKIKEIKDSERMAFEMLIQEKLVADESFRIYMELSKETANEARARAKALRAKEVRA